MIEVDRGGPIPNDIFDYTSDDLYILYRKALDPELQDLVKAIKDREINLYKTSRKAKCN